METNESRGKREKLGVKEVYLIEASWLPHHTTVQKAGIDLKRQTSGA
jgi:hypothetical protein